MKDFIANSDKLVYDSYMKKLSIIFFVLVTGCSIPFSYTYESEAVTLPTLSVAGMDNEYEELPINIPVDGLIPFDFIEFKEVLVRIEAVNDSSEQADAELLLIGEGSDQETLFLGIIPSKGTASFNSVSFLLAEGINNEKFEFTIRAKNKQGDVRWEQYQNEPWVQSIQEKYGLKTIEDIINLQNKEEAIQDALQYIDLKISVKVSLVFKGVLKVDSDMISEISNLMK